MMYGGGGGGGGGYDFGGGGFMPSQSGAATGTASEPTSRRSSAPSSGLVPLTVKQIFSALQTSDDNNFCVDGQDVSNVTLVGLMFNKEEKATDVTFMLDDGTGRVEVKRWIDNPQAPEALDLQNLQSGSYVRIHGHLRTFQNKTNINAFSVRPITDFNEVTFHFLECIYVHLHNIKVKGGAINQVPSSFTSNTPSTFPTNTQAPRSFAMNTTQAPHSFASIQTPSSFNVASAPSSVVPPAQAGGGNQNGVPPSASSAHELNDVQRRVLSVFEEPANIHLEQGLNLSDVMQKLRMPDSVFKPTVTFLINEGFIYSTIDDAHYRSTHGA